MKHDYHDFEGRIKKLLGKNLKPKNKDSQRINRIINLVRRIWKKNPGLRLCQLLGNCFEVGDNYNREDDELEIRLRESYRKDLK